MKRITSAVFALCASIIGLNAEVVTYPAGEGVETLDDFTVKVRQTGGEWQPVAVYPVKVIAPDGTKRSVQTASMAYFDFDGKVEVEVISNKAGVSSARVRPLSYDITPDIDADTLSFTLTRPCNLSVEINGDLFHNLHLFTNGIDTERPTAKEIKRAGKKGSNLIYFGPGIHQLPGDTLLVTSGKTVYIDGGARVKGRILVHNSENVKIHGRGEVHPDKPGPGVHVSKSKNVKIADLIMTQMPVDESDSVTIRNVRAISSYQWGDGMNVYCSSNVTHDGVFCRNSDDCTTIYCSRGKMKGSCRNITMRNAVLWADVAHPIFIGLHGNANGNDVIEDVLYENIDILEQYEHQIDYQGCLAINVGDNNLVRNVTFSDIRIEELRKGQLINFRIFFNKKYCAAPGRGLHNVLVRNLSYNGDKALISHISGYDADHLVKNIRFENLTINGTQIYDNMPGKPGFYKTGDMCNIFVGEHVDNITYSKD